MGRYAVWASDTTSEIRDRGNVSRHWHIVRNALVVAFRSLSPS